jgi:mannosyltransferase
MLCALALGSYRLTDKSLWVDEAASAGFALGGPSAWLADHNMALYYMLLGGWLRVVGSSELALRLPSVLCFALSAPLMYLAARASFGISTARAASVLHVGNAFMLQFGQEARGYMLVVLLVLAAQLTLVRLLDQPRLRFSVLYGVCIGLASYAHLFAFWTLLGHGLVLAPHSMRRGPERRALFTAFALALLISLPLFVQLASATTAQVSWIRPSSALAILALPVIWCGGGVLLALLICALFGMFARGLFTRDARLRLHTQLCVAWLLVPLAATLCLSAIVAPMLVPKYLIGAVPALQLGAAAALIQLPRRASYVTALLLFSLTTLRVYDWYTKQQKERWREAVALLDARMQPTEPLLLDLPCPEPFDYYVVHQHLDARWPPPRWPVRNWAFPTPNEEPVTRETVLAQLVRESPPRIWQISNRSAAPPDLGPLNARYRVSSEQLVARGDSADALFATGDALTITIRVLTRL